MTMPEKISVEADKGYTESVCGVWDLVFTDQGVDYIRADLAAELARALEMAVDYGWLHSDAIDALTRYNKAVGDK